jgi:A/G-specific adenine glycosylase
VRDDEEWRQQVRQWLLAWFEKHRRNLPWRQTRNPYAILVSEILLQQTTVEAARPYFERFLQRFPTVHDLARASLEEVLQVWAGIGYYARARNLHEAAKRIVENFGGQIPSDFETLLQLPGIGRYTAGAIASIAFGKRVPALDTNAIRVLSRLLGWQGDPKSATFQKRLWDAAMALLPDEAPGEFNQALMDLAALICLPEAPKCAACPLQPFCAAAASGVPEQFPTLPQKRQWRERREVACVIWRDECLLVAQRGEGWWQGLWECPRGEMLPDESPLSAAERLAWERLGLTVTAQAILTTLTHTVTVHRIALTAVECRYRSGELQLQGYRDARWLPLEEAQKLPVPSPQAELLAFLTHQRRFGRQARLF